MPERSVCCHGCGREHVLEGPVPRSAVCDSCGAVLKCCLNCRFHDPSSYNECREPSAERVVDKDASNFCDYFDPAAMRGASSGKGGKGGNGGDAHSELDALFGKK